VRTLSSKRVTSDIPYTSFMGKAGTGSSSATEYNRSALGCFRNASALASFLRRAVSGRAMICDLTLDEDFCFLI